MTKKLLSGYRIIEFSQTAGGMHCGSIFAEMGAEVIKISIPDDSEDISEQELPVIHGVSLPATCVNVGKKHVTVDFRKPEGRKLLEKLLKTADVFFTTRQEKDMKEMGFDYEACKKINSGLVYGSLTCFGLTGPFSGKKGGELVAEAFSGCMSATGYRGGRPLRMGYQVGEILGGINLAVGIFAALFERKRSGRGQLVDVSLVDSLVSSMCTCTGHYVINGIMPLLGWSLAGTDDDPQHEQPTARGIFRAKDGYICISANQSRQLELLYECIGMPGRLEEQEFREKAEKMTLCRAINEDIDEWTKQFTKYEAFRIICDHGVPAAPLLDYKEVYENNDIRENRKMFSTVMHPALGEITVTHFPVKMSRYP